MFNEGLTDALIAGVGPHYPELKPFEDAAKKLASLGRRFSKEGLVRQTKYTSRSSLYHFIEEHQRKYNHDILRYFETIYHQTCSKRESRAGKNQQERT